MALINLLTFKYRFPLATEIAQRQLQRHSKLSITLSESKIAETRQFQEWG